MSDLPWSGLLHLDPAEQVLLPDRLQEGGMVGFHVRADRVDHLVVGVASSHVPAFASDDPCHRVLLHGCTPTFLRECWRDLGADATHQDPALWANRHRAGRRTPRGPAARVPGRQGRLLFAYLVLNRHRLTSRDELVEALWPHELPTASEAGLNALISKLR